VIDTRGIYYDPRQPSDLENILQTAEFTPDELSRAAKLRRYIVESGVSKYNPVGKSELSLSAPSGRRVVLVPGQVVDDASVRHGSPIVSDNDALLRAVREACPDAFVVYKPHPDVLSGNRRGGVSRHDRWCDQVVLHVPIDQCFAAVQEVHTMTSLVGFEALLRGLPVVTYGQPFYAGWGLTTDRNPPPRRTRRLSLDELVAGTLLRYPRYFSWTARAFCSAEDMVTELSRARLPDGKQTRRVPWVLRQVRGLVTSAVEWTRAF
jgi:capsular polysaccharide export protein